MLLFVGWGFVCGRKAVEGEGLRLRALRFMSFASPPPPLPYSSVDFRPRKPISSAAKFVLGLT
jgi:hypothetical protein